LEWGHREFWGFYRVVKTPKEYLIGPFCSGIDFNAYYWFFVWLSVSWFFRQEIAAGIILVGCSPAA